MQVIKFKAKRKDDNKWCFGQLVFDKNKIPFIVEELERENQNDVTKLYATNWYEVIPETISRYIGITDKKGIEIYENDIMKNLLGGKGVVKFDKWCGAILDFEESIVCTSFNSSVIRRYKVNGNIYDKEVK